MQIRAFIQSGAEESRTPDLVIANDALYQLSYRPMFDFDRPAERTLARPSGSCPGLCGARGTIVAGELAPAK